ncbi:hypothetical protein F5887DRAFT_1003644 [Amanita rubescens]|nr:hypothetical protein F5887DRAFT_1003644 [Amanita rubescens]
MTPDEIATLETNIVDICKAHETENRRKDGYRPCVSVEPCYFVKYGDCETLGPEITTQKYFFDYAKSQPDTSCVPRIPEIKHCFQKEFTMYLVMEHITLMDPPSDLIKRVAEALKWLSEVKPPFDHVIGPLGGRIRHRVFQDFEAPLPFPNVDALQRYLEKAYTMHPLGMKNGLSPVKISNDRLMFTQSNIDLSNFGVHEQDKTVFMDFRDIGLLPETFVTYTMRLAPISLGLLNDSFATLTRIRLYLGMVGDDTLGTST